jgi:hypothetical protein
MYELYEAPDMFLAEGGSYHPLCPVEDEYVAGEIVNRWFHREQSRRLMNLHEAEMLEFDATLGELLYRRKQMLCRLGRNGGWSLWLRQQNIQRSTADRLVAQYAESYGLTDELRHRETIEPLQGNVCLAANRTSKRLKNMLKTPRSRMMFVNCLADRFGLGVDFGGDGSVHLSLSAPNSEEDCSDRVPSVLQVLDNGTVAPANYELKDEGDENVFLPTSGSRPAAPKSSRKVE